MVSGEDLHCYPECSSTFQTPSCLVCDDVFSLHLMKKEANRERGCTPGFQEFICHGVSVLAMGSSCSISSCNEAQLSEKMTNELASGWSVVWSPIGAGRVMAEGYVSPSFLQ